MTNSVVAQNLEKLFAHPFRLSGRIARLARLKGVAQLLRNAGWRAGLGSFGPDSLIHAHVVIHSPDKLTLGARCSVAEFVHIWAGGGVTIGNNVMIASHAVISSQSHDIDAPVMRDSALRAPISIEDDVWIGAGAIVLPGVTIGRGSMVAAGAVVTRDVPPRSLVAGVPATLVRTLADNA